MSLRESTLAIAVAAIVVSGAPTGAQSTPPPAQQTPTFRTRIDAVTVDVIAVDKAGKPVTDLTAADFEIKESGKTQSIDSFKRILVEGDRFDPDPVRAQPITSLESMQREAARDDVRLITIFLDDYHTRRGNAMAVREKLARFVQDLDPRDLVAVMYPLTPTLGVTFSRDHDGIANAIRRFEGRKYDYMIRYPQEEIYQRLSRPQIEELRNTIVIEALEGLCVYLGTLREGRKTILMVSEGLASSLPVEISSGGMVSSPAPNTLQDIQNSRGRFRNQVDLLNRMRDIFSAANRTNTSIYTMDPRGLATSEFDLSQPAVAYENDRNVLNESLDGLRVIADQTDGRAIVGKNDPLPDLRQMLADTSAYYLLGYTSTEAPRDGKFHEIKVSVKRKGVDIRYRKGYWAYSPEDIERANAPAKPDLPADVAEALASVSAPERGHPVTTWVGFDRAADGRTNVTLVWESTEAGGRGDAPEQLNVFAASMTGDVLFRGRVPKSEGALTPAGRVTFPARPGAMRLRMTAEGGAGQFIDAEDRELVVPDFTAVGPTVTSPEVYRARTARELQQLRESAAALPTGVKVFTRSEQLLVRFRAYGPGGTTPAVTVRLLNALGEPMSTLPAPTARPDGVLELPISLGGLATGNYMLEFEAVSSDQKSRTLWGFKIGS